MATPLTVTAKKEPWEATCEASRIGMESCRLWGWPTGVEAWSNGTTPTTDMRIMNTKDDC